MLTVNDLHDHFAKIPRDFDLIVNDQNYKCNKQVMCAFSKVICSDAKTSSKYSCNIPTNEQSINTVISFLHGGKVDFSENSYETYLIAANLDISILKSRLCEHVTASTTKENFDSRYNILSTYPNYCDPLFMFLANNKDYFSVFTKSHTLSLSFANAFLTSTPSFFNSEDDKVIFIISILNSNNIDDKNDNDFSIVSNINLCGVNEETLYNFLKHPLSSKFSPFLNVFPILEKQINAISVSEKKMAELQKEVNEAQSTYENESNINNSLSNDFNALNAQFFNIEVQHFELKQKINEIINDLKSAKLSLQAVQQLNDEYLPFLESVESMQSTSKQLVDVLQNFYNIGGKTIYPGSSRDALKHSKEWNTECTNLRSRIPNIFIKEQLDQYFNILNETENILSSIMPVRDPSLNRHSSNI